MHSDESDDYKFNGYVDLQDYTHSSIDVHIQDKTTEDQDISFEHNTLYSATFAVSGTPVNNCLHSRGTRRVKLMPMVLQKLV